jgi:hypothetical protein
MPRRHMHLGKKKLLVKKIHCYNIYPNLMSNFVKERKDVASVYAC